MVRKPRSVRIGATWRMALWWAGAKKNATLASSSARSCCSAVAARLTPSSVSTSAAPEREETARLPCLAIFNPPPAQTKATAVETLSVCRPSPPVPQTSMTWNG